MWPLLFCRWHDTLEKKPDPLFSRPHKLWCYTKLCFKDKPYCNTSFLCSHFFPNRNRDFHKIYRTSSLISILTYIACISTVYGLIYFFFFLLKNMNQQGKRRRFKIQNETKGQNNVKWRNFRSSLLFITRKKKLWSLL